MRGEFWEVNVTENLQTIWHNSTGVWLVWRWYVLGNGSIFKTFCNVHLLKFSAHHINFFPIVFLWYWRKNSKAAIFVVEQPRSSFLYSSCTITRLFLAIELSTLGHPEKVSSSNKICDAIEDNWTSYYPFFCSPSELLPLTRSQRSSILREWQQASFSWQEWYFWYIVHEARETREERERERERERRKWRHQSEIGDQFTLSFPPNSHFLLQSASNELTLSVVKNFALFVPPQMVRQLIEELKKKMIECTAAASLPSKKGIILIPKPIGNRKKRLCVRLLKEKITRSENLQIAKHKSARCLSRSSNWFVLCDLQAFLGGFFTLSSLEQSHSTSCAIPFSISNIFLVLIHVSVDQARFYMLEGGAHFEPLRLQLCANWMKQKQMWVNSSKSYAPFVMRVTWKHLCATWLIHSVRSAEFRWPENDAGNRCLRVTKSLSDTFPFLWLSSQPSST